MDSVDPGSYRKAIEHPRPTPRWSDTVNEELRSLDENSTWEHVRLEDVPAGVTPISSNLGFRPARARQSVPHPEVARDIFCGHAGRHYGREDLGSLGLRCCEFDSNAYISVDTRIDATNGIWQTDGTGQGEAQIFLPLYVDGVFCSRHQPNEWLP